MTLELGHFALWLAFASTLVQASVPLWGAVSEHPAAMRVADTAAELQFLAAAAFAALTYAFVVSDFSVSLVALNSHSMKPMLYKVTGTRAYHEGSMLLWVLLLALFGALIALFGREFRPPSVLRSCRFRP